MALQPDPGPIPVTVRVHCPAANRPKLKSPFLPGRAEWPHRGKPRCEPGGWDPLGRTRRGTRHLSHRRSKSSRRAPRRKSPPEGPGAQGPRGSLSPLFLCREDRAGPRWRAGPPCCGVGGGRAGKRCVHRPQSLHPPGPSCRQDRQPPCGRRLRASRCLPQPVHQASALGHTIFLPLKRSHFYTNHRREGIGGQEKGNQECLGREATWLHLLCVPRALATAHQQSSSNSKVCLITQHFSAVAWPACSPCLALPAPGVGSSANHEVTGRWGFLESLP